MTTPRERHLKALLQATYDLCSADGGGQCMCEADELSEFPSEGCQRREQQAIACSRAYLTSLATPDDNRVRYVVKHQGPTIVKPGETIKHAFKRVSIDWLTAIKEE